MDHTHQNSQKIKTEWKVPESPKNGPTASNIGDQIGKTDLLGVNFIHRRNNENFVKLQKKIEESIRFKSDPEGNVVNLTALLSQKFNINF